MNPKETLEYIDGYIQEILADDKYDMHLRTVKCFNKIRELIEEVDITDARDDDLGIVGLHNHPEGSLLLEPDVVISCDASITKNPGGEAAIAFVVRRRGMKPYDQCMAMPQANTANEAEYDAIYHAVEHVKDWPGKFGGMHIHIISDSQLAVYQLKGSWECKEPRLIRKKKFILELIDGLPDSDTRHEKTRITSAWKPRNSTKDLKQANYIAQDALGVTRH